jgi:hypothetical protein
LPQPRQPDLLAPSVASALVRAQDGTRTMQQAAPHPFGASSLLPWPTYLGCASASTGFFGILRFALSAPFIARPTSTCRVCLRQALGLLQPCALLFCDPHPFPARFLFRLEPWSTYLGCTSAGAGSFGILCRALSAPFIARPTSTCRVRLRRSRGLSQLRALLFCDPYFALAGGEYVYRIVIFFGRTLFGPMDTPRSFWR